jgi:hypothetical protein
MDMIVKTYAEDVDWEKTISNHKNILEGILSNDMNIIIAAKEEHNRDTIKELFRYGGEPEIYSP